MDFKKAFDTVSHDGLWQVLLEEEVSADYVHILASIYEGTSAQVKLDLSSRKFKIGRLVKQGDAISPMLFNCCLERILKDEATMIKPKIGSLIREWSTRHFDQLAPRR